VNVLFDHNLSFRLARALAALLSDQHTIVALKDKFPTDVDDIAFITTLSRKGHWVVISGDYRITRNKAERQAFQQSRLTGFFMAPALKKAPVLKQLERLCALWDTIVTVTDATAPGALFELPVKTMRVRQLKL
jgi:PIN like domain